jgi:hypothetical protein
VSERNIVGAFRSADLFKNAALLLGKTMGSQRPLSTPYIFNAAMSTELFLKCLIALEGNKVPKNEHDHVNLFQRLSQDSRDALRSEYNRHPYVERFGRAVAAMEPTIKWDFDSALQAGRRAHLFSRYAHEEATNMKFGEGWSSGPVIDVLRLRILFLRPDLEE